MAYPVTVQELVDATLDVARSAHPGAEFSIVLAGEHSLRLPRESEKLLRPGPDGESGYYGGHVYRDCLVNAITGMADHFVAVQPVANTSTEADAAPTYYGDLRTGKISTTLPK